VYLASASGPLLIPLHLQGDGACCLDSGRLICPKKKYAYPSLAGLEETLGYSRRTLQRAIDELVTAEFLLVSHKHGCSSRYVINPFKVHASHGTGTGSCEKQPLDESQNAEYVEEIDEPVPHVTPVVQENADSQTAGATRGVTPMPSVTSDPCHPCRSYLPEVTILDIYPDVSAYSRACQKGSAPPRLTEEDLCTLVTGKGCKALENMEPPSRAEVVQLAKGLTERHRTHAMYARAVAAQPLLIESLAEAQLCGYPISDDTIRDALFMASNLAVT